MLVWTQRMQFEQACRNFALKIPKLFAESPKKLYNYIFFKEKCFFFSKCSSERVEGSLNKHLKFCSESETFYKDIFFHKKNFLHNVPLEM